MFIVSSLMCLCGLAELFISLYNLQSVGGVDDFYCFFQLSRSFKEEGQTYVKIMSCDLADLEEIIQ